MAKKKTETNGTTAAPPNVTEATPVVPEAPNGPGTVIRVFSYPVKEDTVVQALVHEKTVLMKNGKTFIAHQVTAQKVWTTPSGEKKCLYTYRCSELYALIHAIQRAEAYVLDLREESDCPL